MAASPVSNLCFPNTEGVGCFFMWVVVIHASLMKCPNLSPIKNEVLFLIAFYELFIYSGYNSFIRCMISKYFLPNLGLPFQNSLNSIFQ